MLDHQDAFYLGYIKRTHGLQGELELVLDTDNPQAYKNKESVWIEIHHQLVPFFIEHISIKGHSAIVKFKNINTRDQFETLVGCSVWLPLIDLHPISDPHKYYFHELNGLTAIDKYQGEIGVIKEVMDHLKQPVLVIQHGSKEIMLPLIDEFVTHIDRENSKLHVVCPPGLIELYLEE